VGEGETQLLIEPRFDSTLTTKPALTLRYGNHEQRESLMVRDALTLKETLGVDQLALLVIRPRGNTWSIEVNTVDSARSTSRTIGQLNFSEVAGYDPKRLQQLVRALAERTSHEAIEEIPQAAPVALAGPQIPKVDAQSLPPSNAHSSPDAEADLTVLGMITCGVGVASLATSWALFVERRAFRLQNWPTVTANDERAYARRGTWTVASLLLGASALAVSPYFLLQQTESVPTYAWILGSVGLAAAAVGIGAWITDEHCGPEVVLPLRQPCRSVRADSLFGIEVALTALPLITLPLNYVLRGATRAELTVDSHNRAIALHIGGNL
jgi:hypothetical protein